MSVVKVRLFAALRDLAGSSEVEAEGSNVGEVVDGLSARFGERFAAIARSGSVIVDGERSGRATPLAGDEEVAVLPPVSGGCAGNVDIVVLSY
jgi:MoaD family protein